MSFAATTTTMSRLFTLSTTTPKPTLFHLSSPTTTTFLRRTSFTPPLTLTTPHLKPLPLRFSTTTTTITAAITPGTALPSATFSYLDSSNEVQTLTTSDLTASKTSILFAVPGAFTPTCSQKHVPSFLQSAAALKSKGVDLIACVSINDAFVMKAWKDSLGASDSGDVLFLSDINGEFTKAIGAELDLTDKPVGLGVRSRRYAMLVDNGVVKTLNLEEGGAFTFSGAEDMLKLL